MTTDLSSLSGLELMQTLAAQLSAESAGERSDPTAQAPSIGRLLGMRMESVEPGQVVFSVTTTPDFSNPLGQVHGGICATLLDSAMGCAVHTQLEAGVGYGTVEMKLNYIRSVPTDGTVLTATGSVIHIGGRTAVAEGRVVDDQGRLVAHGTETCIIHR
jgi:uncharacterized protein (TIGR00369 family)